MIERDEASTWFDNTKYAMTRGWTKSREHPGYQYLDLPEGAHGLSACRIWAHKLSGGWWCTLGSAPGGSGGVPGKSKAIAAARLIRAKVEERENAEAMA